MLSFKRLKAPDQVYKVVCPVVNKRRLAKMKNNILFWEPPI